MATATEEVVVDRGAQRQLRRQRWGGCSLIVSAFTLATAEIIHPEVMGDGAPALALSFATTPQTWTAWSLLLMATAMLQLPGVLAWRGRVASGKGAGLVSAGTATLAAALVALFAFGQSHGQGVAYAGAQPVDPAVLDAFTRAESAAPLGLTLILALFGFHLGWPLVLLGLARAAAIPVPLAFIGSAAAVGSFFADPLGHVAESAAFVVLAVVLVASSLPLLRKPQATQQ